MKRIKVLSLFDGISCAQVALKRLGFDVEYYASEIDKYAIEITQARHPNTAQLGNVKDITKKQLRGGVVHLLVGGSPCQDLSIAKKDRKGLSGDRSGLFYEYVRILKEVKPRYFLLENVASMPKDAMQEITKELGVEPIMINAALVSAQNRKRYFWTNIPNVKLPEDRKIYLKDILEKGEIPIDRKGKEKLKSNTIRTGGSGSGIGDKHNWDSIMVGSEMVHMVQSGRGYNKGGIRALDGKSPTLTSSAWEHNNHLVKNGTVRKLTVIECERLQCLPDGYTEGVSDSQRYKALGNAFNVEVVMHILGSMEL